MNDFLNPSYQCLLQVHGVGDFEALWALELEAVDEPNTERGGWSNVCRLELLDGDRVYAFYLKRQCNHRTLSWQRPFGEPTFARELRSIKAYAAGGIAALEAVFYAERPSSAGTRAILLTAALSDYQPLSDVLPQWEGYEAHVRQQWCTDIGIAIASLHNAYLTHHCLYPRHVFLSTVKGSSTAPVRFIDLEKTRYQVLVWRDRVADLESLLRRCKMWAESERQTLLSSYLSHLDRSMSLVKLQTRLQKRHANKLARA